MLKKILLFLLLGVVSYTVFLVALLPVSVVWSQFSHVLPLAQTPLKVKGVSGTVWNGDALGSVNGVVGVLGWNTSISGVLLGQLPIDLIFKSSVGSLQTKALLSLNGIELMDTSGDIQLLALTPLLKGTRVSLSGAVTIEHMNIGYHEGVISPADALISWSGGEVKYPAGREIHGGVFPPFVGSISQKNDLTVFSIREKDSIIDVVDGELDATGVAMVRVKRRLLDLANEPWPKNSSESDVVFKIKRKIL